MNVTRCFISYSHENDDHRDWVRNLATKLTKNNVHVFLDQWDLTYGHDLPNYMETSIRQSNFVLLVCTPEFAKKANRREGGVGYEKTIVTGEIFQDSCSPEKFVPILKKGNHTESLPSYLKGKLFADFREDNKFEERFDDLLRHIFKKPKYSRPDICDSSTTLEKNTIIQKQQKSNNKNKIQNSMKLCSFAMQPFPNGLSYYPAEADSLAEKCSSFSEDQVKNFIDLCSFAMQSFPNGLSYYPAGADSLAEKCSSFSEDQVKNFIDLCSFAMQSFPNGLSYYPAEADSLAEKCSSFSEDQVKNFIDLCLFAMQPFPNGLSYYPAKAVTYARKNLSE